MLDNSLRYVSTKVNRRTFLERASAVLVAVFSILRVKRTIPAYRYDWSVWGGFTNDPKFALNGSEETVLPYGINRTKVFLNGLQIDQSDNRWYGKIMSIQSGEDGWIETMVRDKQGAPVIELDSKTKFERLAKERTHGTVEVLPNFGKVPSGTIVGYTNYPTRKTT